MNSRSDIKGIDSKPTCYGQNGFHRTMIDRKLSTLRNHSANGTVTYPRKARLAFIGKKTKLAVVTTVVLLVCAFVVAIAPTLLSSKIPAKTFADPGWGTAELVETSDSEDARWPDVAIDSAGNAIAVWGQYELSRYNLWSSRYVVGEGWGDAELIETGVFSVGNPHVAMNDAGNAVAVWEQSAGPSRWDVWSNRYVVGSGWQGTQLVETTDTGDAFRAEVAVDNLGNAIVAWIDQYGTFANISANRYVVGGGWGIQQVLDTEELGDAWSPEIAMDSAGNAIVVWDQFDGTCSNIWSNRYVVGVGWGTAECIEDAEFDAGTPDIAVDTSGNAVAVWVQSSGTEETGILSIWSNRYVVGDGWGTAEPIDSNDYDAGLAQVAIDNEGNAVAVWFQSDGTRDNIWSNRYVDSVGWGDAELIESDNLGNAQYPHVDVDGAGNAIAAWYQSDGTRNNIWSNRYVVDVGWGVAEIIETSNSGSANRPRVAVNSAGEGVVVWHQSDGTLNHIWSNRYEPYLIPEFPNTIVSVIGIALVFLVFLTSRKKRNW